MSTEREGAYVVRFDPESGTLQGPAGEHRLSPKAASVLVLLIEDAGRVVSKEQLLAAAWPDVVVSDDALSTVIYELRRALGESARNPRYVETLRKRGYRWVGPPPTSSMPSPMPSLTPSEVPSAQKPTPQITHGSWRIAAPVAVLAIGLVVGAHPRGDGRNAAPALSEPSPVACDLLLRGVRSASEGTPEAVQRAVERLEQAAALEPDWPPVQLALAESYLELGTAPAIERARLALERAERLGGDPTELHLLHAALRLRVDRDPASAQRELRVARERSSCGSDRVDVQTAETLSALGRQDEAVALLRRLAEEQPGAVTVQRALGRSLALAGHLHEAEESLSRSLEMAPYHVPTLRRLAAVRARLGDAEASWQATRREAYALRLPLANLEALDAEWRDRGLQGVLRWRLEHAEALALDAVDRAAIWADLGELERAAGVLRAAGSAGEAGLVWVAVDPAFAALRKDARYRELLAELAKPAPLSRS